MPQAAPPAIENLIDAGSFDPSDEAVAPADPVGYPGYADALARARERSGSAESVVAGAATVGGVAVEVAAFDFDFMGGSMGTVAGELLARALERAEARRVPFVLRTATGGARMQEGMASLVQMPKVAAARLGLADASQPFVAVLGHPTTGGVLASLAALADVTIAETGATVGFAGPRVVQAATGRAPSPDSHSAGSALAAGLVDAVVDPAAVGEAVATALSILTASDTVSPPAAFSSETFLKKTQGAASNLDAGSARDPWEALQAVRAPGWPRGPELARGMSDEWFELRGDRSGTDDRALAAALATVSGFRVLLLALDRARPPGPGAYRKAIRCLRLAGRLGIPVVTLVDTTGADPSEPSEAGGIAWAIAELFETMLAAPVPIVSVLTGEGGSGGALAFAAGDVLLAYEDAVFSVIAPELAAEIMWRDAARGADAARLLKMGAADLAALGIADAVIGGRPEPSSLGALVAYHLARSEPYDSRRTRWRHRLGH